MSKEYAKKVILDQFNQYATIAEAYAELVEEGKIPSNLLKKKKDVDLKELRSQINELRRYNTVSKGLLSLEIETVSYREVLKILDELEENAK